MVMGLSFLDDFHSSLAKDHLGSAEPESKPDPKPRRSMLDRVLEGESTELAARWWCEAVFEGFGAA
jgi:hypothetical protein